MPEFDASLEYRDVSGFPGYRVATDGSVWGRRRGQWRTLAHRPDPHYLRVTLCRGPALPKVRRPVHALVLEAFVGPCPDGLECCHENDDPTDNRLENLRWGTQKANAADAMRNGRKDSVRGTRHHSARLDEAAVRAIRASCASGENRAAVARRFGVLSGR